MAKPRLHIACKSHTQGIPKSLSFSVGETTTRRVALKSPDEFDEYHDVAVILDQL